MLISNELIASSTEAICHLDDVEAKKIIPQLEQFVISQNVEKVDPVLFKKLKRLHTHLQLVAIPQLSDEETFSIIQSHFLDSFEAGIDMENRLTVKLFYVPAIPRDRLREKLKQALLRNQQKLGSLTIGQWLIEFEKAFDIKTRNLSASVEFVRSNRNAQMLSALEKENLKELIHTYDYLLVTTLPVTGPALYAIINSDQQTSSNSYSSNEQPSDYSAPTQYTIPQKNSSYSAESEPQIEQLALSDALKKYPEVSEQVITSGRIALKSFSEPVRPSVKNWLSDYTFTMGFDPHDSAARGTYLFHNGNTRSLGTPDKNRLNYVLKAFDTNEPVTVNTTAKQIIFPPLEIEARPAVATPPASPLSKNFPAAPPVAAAAPAFKSTFSGNFTLTRQNPSGPALSTERRLPPAPKEALLPAGHNIPPKTPRFSAPEVPTSQAYQSSPQYRPRIIATKDPLPTATDAEMGRAATRPLTLPANQPPMQRRPYAPMTKDPLPTASGAETVLPSTSNLAFTSPQKLPFEKETPVAAEAVPNKPQEEIYAPRPMRIMPMSHGKSYPSKNIVDLKK